MGMSGKCGSILQKTTENVNIIIKISIKLALRKFQKNKWKNSQYKALFDSTKWYH